MNQFNVVLILFPLIGACVWWILGRAWVSLMQGGQMSDRTNGGLHNGFWIVLVAAYAVMIVTGFVQHKF